MPKLKLSQRYSEEEFERVMDALDEFDLTIGSFDDVLVAILTPLAPHFDQIREELST